MNNSVLRRIPPVAALLAAMCVSSISAFPSLALEAYVIAICLLLVGIAAAGEQFRRKNGRKTLAWITPAGLVCAVVALLVGISLAVRYVTLP